MKVNIAECGAPKIDSYKTQRIIPGFYYSSQEGLGPTGAGSASAESNFQVDQRRSFWSQLQKRSYKKFRTIAILHTD